nr:hypothetical protein MOLUWOTD_MOLUWOTD_CDS_0004 [Microvirus sp.]
MVKRVQVCTLFLAQCLLDVIVPSDTDSEKPFSIGCY